MGFFTRFREEENVFYMNYGPSQKGRFLGRPSKKRTQGRAMKDLEHLTEEKLEYICKRLWQVRYAILGMGAMFEYQGTEACYSQDELFGIGQALKLSSRELEVLEDILRCGYDSTAIEKKK